MAEAEKNDRSEILELLGMIEVDATNGALGVQTIADQEVSKVPAAIAIVVKHLDRLASWNDSASRLVECMVYDQGTW
jgi:hypothetical protein